MVTVVNFMLSVFHNCKKKKCVKATDLNKQQQKSRKNRDSHIGTLSFWQQVLRVYSNEFKGR